jgi:hypothetical protein
MAPLSAEPFVMQNFRLDLDSREALLKYCREHDLTMSEFFRAAIRNIAKDNRRLTAA